MPARLPLWFWGLLVAYAAVAPVAYALEGRAGLLAAAVAAALCATGAIVGRLLQGRPEAPGAIYRAMLVGTFARLVPPLTWLLLAKNKVIPELSRGLPYYLVIFYLVVLAAEVKHALPAAAQNPGRPPDA